MKTNYSKFFRKLASFAYSAGVLSLIVGLLLSTINQTVYASSQNTGGGGDHKVWICHVPPGNPGNARAINVDANGWNGHDNHAGDFQISGENDPRCGGDDEEESTKTPKPTKTSKPTEVKVTETKEPTEVKVTETKEPTEVKVTETKEPTEVEETETKEPTEVEDTNTPTATQVVGSTQTPTDTPTDGPTATGTFTPTDTPTNGPTSTGTATPTDTATPTITDTPTDTATPTITDTPTDTATPTATEVSFKRLSVNWECVDGQQLWTITNPNAFAVNVDWSFSSGPGPGSTTIPANSSYNFTVAGGYHTITVTWNDGENNQSLSSTTSPNSPCAITGTTTATQISGDDTTSTPTKSGTTGQNPTATRQARFFATLAATVDPSQEVLIPVTGADFSNPFSNRPLSSIFLNLGFVFLGMAFLTHGLSSKLK